MKLAAVLCIAVSYASAQAPIIDASQPMSRSSSNGGSNNNSGNSSNNNASSNNASSSNSSPTAQLYLQLQSLQQEVMELRGVVEEQRHQIDTLRQQSLDRYTDLDKRLSGGAPAAATSQPEANSAPTADNAATNSAPTTAVPIAAAASSNVMQTAKPEEYEAYQKAYAKLKGQDFSGAIKAFNSFIETYPSSTLVGNAYYWLGKAYLQPPQDLTKAQQAFSKVVGDSPQHVKAPDALYELGKIYYLKGDKVKAKTLLQQVIDNYGTSGSTAPQLAKQYLDQNFHK